MHRLVQWSLALALVCASLPLLARQGNTWDWAGSWTATTQGWQCRHVCQQRKVNFLRAGQTPVQDTLTMFDTNGGGAIVFYCVIGRCYTWNRGTQLLSFLGTPDDLGRLDIQNPNRPFTGLGPVLARVPKAMEAIPSLLDDAARAFLEAEIAAARKADRATGQGGGSGRKYDVEAIRRKDEADLAAFKHDHVQRLLSEAEAAIGRKDYRDALQSTRLAGVVNRTKEVDAMEKRVLGLIDEEAAARKAEDQAADAAGRKRLVTGVPKGAKVRPNPYDTRDPERPVAVDPYDWKDSPKDVQDMAVLKKMAAAARKAHDGYRLVQLVAKRFHSDLDFAPLSDLLAETFDIAEANRDPWLMFHLAKIYWRACYHRYYKDFALSNEPAFFYREAYQLAVERREPLVLDRLWEAQRKYDVIPDMNARQIQDKANELRGSR